MSFKRVECTLSSPTKVSGEAAESPSGFSLKTDRGSAYNSLSFFQSIKDTHPLMSKRSARGGIRMWPQASSILKAPLSIGLLLFALLHSGELLAADRMYVGALGGISTLSADGRAKVSAASSSISSYKPENGPTFNLFVGRHLNNYVTVQGTYCWNRNDLTLSSVSISDAGQDTYEQSRSSAQHAVFGDLLVYFRNLRSRVRPYLSVGGGWVRLESTAEQLRTVVGSPLLPPARFVSNVPASRFTVGIDLYAVKGWAFRYSFSETIRSNAISSELVPPGERRLANFQNFFGVLKQF